MITFTVLVDHLKLYEGPLPIQNWLGDEVNQDFDANLEGDRFEEVTKERGTEDKGDTSDSLDTLGDNALVDLFRNVVGDPGGTPSIADESRGSIEEGTIGVDSGMIIKWTQLTPVRRSARPRKPKVSHLGF